MDEVGNMGTRISIRQEDVGDVDSSSNDMGVSFHCELKFSSYFGPTSFEEDATRES